LSDVVLLLSHYLPDLYHRLQLSAQPTAVEGGDIAAKLHTTAVRASELMQYPECQVFLYNLLFMKLIDDGDYKSVNPLLLSNSYFRVGQRIWRLYLFETTKCEFAYT
jgi:hypothetical protein